MLQTKRMGDWFEIVIPKEWDGINLENVFHQVWDAPKKLTHQFRMEKRVKVNGVKADWTLPLSPGDRLTLQLFVEEENNLIPWVHEVPILFEDEHIIIFNKPADMSTHPNDPNLDKSTLLNAAAYYMQAQGEKGMIRHIHRLDKDTSGAILFAKHALMAGILDRMLERREIKRTYLAWVQGVLKSKKGIIKEPIGRDRHHAVRRRVSKTGQPAVTHYQVLKLDKMNQLSLVKVWLDSGRTHQIRVHFSYLGHPLAGDLIYGGKPIFKRQALHAAKLEFIHPLTKEKIKVLAPFTDEPSIFTGIDPNSI